VLGAHYVSEYDNLGRPLSLTSHSATLGDTVLWELTYDEDHGHCDGNSARAAGRLSKRQDSYGSGVGAGVAKSFGAVYYCYDAEGRVTKELYERANYGGVDARVCAGTCIEDQLVTRYSYDQAGRLQWVRSPHGRVVAYTYWSGFGQDEHVRSVKASLNDQRACISGGCDAGYTCSGGACVLGTPQVCTEQSDCANGTYCVDGACTGVETLVQDVRWEPFGGVRSYTGPSRPSGTPWQVEYLLGDAASETSAECGMGREEVTDNDYSGRLRELWVSSGSGGTGDLYKRRYVWSADQITKQYTCVGTTSAAKYVQSFSYDHALRVTNESGGSQGASRTYAYTARGERSSYAYQMASGGGGGRTLTAPCALSQGRPDQLVDASASPAPGETWKLYYSYAYDEDGRLLRKWQPLSESHHVQSVPFDFAYGDAAHGAVDAVYSSAQVNFVDAAGTNGVGYGGQFN